jgi:hypothetical protein
MENTPMKAVRNPGYRFRRALFACLCATLLALQAGAAHAGPAPVISAKFVGVPAHVHVTGKYFTPGSPVLVVFDYYPMKKRFVKIIVATKSGTISVNRAVLSLKCGVETIKITASNPSTNSDSNTATLYFHRHPCS